MATRAGGFRCGDLLHDVILSTAGKGISSSALPFKRTAPAWLSKTSPSEVEDLIAKFAKKGFSPSQIGVSLRDSYGIAQVKAVTGTKILRVLKKKGVFVFLCGFAMPPGVVVGVFQASRRSCPRICIT